MAVFLLMMAQSKDNAKNSNDEVQPTIFHDFLGRSCASDSSPAVGKSAPGGAGGDARPSEASPTASASLGASSGGGRGPISAASDLGSERHAANRSDLTGTELSNRFAGNKRSNSDSAFMGSSRDGLPHVGSDSLDGLHLMKVLRTAGGERPRHSHDEAMFLSMLHPVRPTPASLVLNPPAGSRTDVSASKWERAIPLNVGPGTQYPPRVGQFTPFGCQVPSNRFKDANAGPSVISQAAADEGSRTGIKGSGVLTSIHASRGGSDRIPSGVLITGSKHKSSTYNSEPESSNPPSQHGLTSAGRQMTIFYGGQAHVFDDVHPNKADVIMALAGSNGGSWSTTYAPKSAAPIPGETSRPSRENETGMASNFASSWELRRRLPITGTSSHGFGSADQISVPPGAGALMKDGRTTIQAVETRSEEKREV